jgi:AAA domain
VKDVDDFFRVHPGLTKEDLMGCAKEFQPEDENNSDIPRKRSSINGEHSQEEKTTQPLQGASLLELSKRKVPTDKIFLGNRWLCAGGGGVLIGPSGVGKSTMAVQAAALWACGRSAFDIEPTGPLRVMIVQAEDDEGDSIEMARVIEDLELSADQLDLVGKNTHLEFLNDKTSIEFTRRLDEMLELWPCDLVIINPLSAYLGADTKDEEKVNQFLRSWMNPILTARRVAAIFIHHTPKTTNRDTSGWRASDWMYAGSGVAGITNWARAILVIDPTDTPGVFKLMAAKRGQRIGWDGFEQFWAHSSEVGKLLWVPASPDQIALAKNRAKSKPEDLLGLIPPLDPVSQEKLFQIASEKGFPEKKSRRFLKILEEDGKIHRHRIPRAGIKSAIGYAKVPPVE